MYDSTLKYGHLNPPKEEAIFARGISYYQLLSNILNKSKELIDRAGGLSEGINVVFETKKLEVEQKRVLTNIRDIISSYNNLQLNYSSQGHISND